MVDSEAFMGSLEDLGCSAWLSAKLEPCLPHVIQSLTFTISHWTTLQEGHFPTLLKRILSVRPGLKTRLFTNALQSRDLLKRWLLV